jgi:uncharacterized membrane protein
VRKFKITVWACGGGQKLCKISLMCSQDMFSAFSKLAIGAHIMFCLLGIELFKVMGNQYIILIFEFYMSLCYIQKGHPWNIFLA